MLWRKREPAERCYRSYPDGDDQEDLAFTRGGFTSDVARSATSIRGTQSRHGRPEKSDQWRCPSNSKTICYICDVISPSKS